MEKHPGAQHRRKPEDLRVTAVPANGQRAKDAVDFKQGKLVSSPAVFPFVSSGQMDLRILMDDGAARRDDMDQVEETAGSLPQRTDDGPDAGLFRRPAGLDEGVL